MYSIGVQQDFDKGAGHEWLEHKSTSGIGIGEVSKEVCHTLSLRTLFSQNPQVVYIFDKKRI